MANVKLLYGPMLIGVFFNMILYGVLLVQTYHYYLTYKRDASWIKLLVLYLFCIETINTGCNMAIMFQPLIDRFGLPEATIYFPTLFASGAFSAPDICTLTLPHNADPITIVLVSTPIQLFFAWRIYLLTKSKALTFAVTAFALISLGGGTWTTILLIKIKLFARKPELHWPALVWFLSASIADVLITIVLVLTLSKCKTGFVATDDAIAKIIRITVQTGMLTAFLAIADVVFFMSLPHTTLNFVWDLALSKVYANCLLSTLNSRLSTQYTSGYSVSQQKQGPPPSGGPLRFGENGIDTPAHILNSSVYELDARKQFSPSDIEYDVTITKIVETRQDPTPLRPDFETQ
ncbi:hypothetical protein BDN70DRAFT_878286 [Pholiota conissans]|uniref:DUF6534 domain-containing protein n=1 Tax=Pholiota conissans TaxID=109636 RepID=A0A9P5Z1S8_9AGAR|nr:hypothetical protein BDN70DRAFT_878286 [Pholiota conissans]